MFCRATNILMNKDKGNCTIQMYRIHCTSHPPPPYWRCWKADLFWDAFTWTKSVTCYYITCQRGLKRRPNINKPHYSLNNNEDIIMLYESQWLIGSARNAHAQLLWTLECDLYPHTKPCLFWFEFDAEIFLYINYISLLINYLVAVD